MEAMQIKRTRIELVFVGFLILVLLLSACGGNPTQVVSAEPTSTEAAEAHEAEEQASEGEEEEHEAEEHASEAHEDEPHSHIDVPAAYEGLTNPYSDDMDAIAAGGETYASLCASCHGDEGAGDGPAAAGLDPKPASLADHAMMDDASDGYLFWRITEGGATDLFKSAMPAWGDALSEEEIWKVIAFIRSFDE